MTASRRRIGSLEILEGRRLMAADVMAALPADLPEAPTALIAKAASDSGPVEADFAAAKLPTRPTPGGPSRPASSASPAVQDAAFADSLPPAVAVELETCLVSNWSHTGSGGSSEVELDRAFIKSWSTSGDADDRSGEDINIGVGELQECTISKSMDSAAPNLAQFAINGNSPGAADIHFAEVGGGASAADDRPTEEVAFYYNRIAFQY